MTMDNDDFLVGRLLSRREAFRLLGAGGAVALTGWKPDAAGLPSCVVRPEMTEGPFFVDNSIFRSDVRVDTTTGVRREGTALDLAFNLFQVVSGRCAPLPAAIVHVWQCDAAGIYSGVQRQPNDNALRGIQSSDAQGRVKFTTIYPGWYRGRAVHIHFKIRTQASGSAYEYTSQLFFPESLNDAIHALPPYASHGRRDTLNERDGIYRGGGDQLLLKPAPSAGGYVAAMDIALDLSDARVGRSDGRGTGRGGR